MPKSGEDDRSPWRDFTLDNSLWNGETTNPLGGRIYDVSIVQGPTTAWYPAAGRHTFTDGTLMNFSREGVCWSSSAYGTDSYRFLYLRAESRPTDGGLRCTGFSVRCIRE